MATKYRLVLVAAPTEKEAQKLARGLLEEKIAACVNLIPGVQSQYWWKGKIESAHEAILLIKTQKALVDTVIGYIRENHSYELPEVIALPVMEGDKEYLNWLGAQTNAAKPLVETPDRELEA